MTLEQAPAVTARRSAVRVVRLVPTRGIARLDLRELWEYRELAGFLVLRDLKVKYRQTLLGAAWAVLQPVATMVVFSLVFGRLAGLSSDGAPYPVFSLAGLVPWTFFGTALGTGSLSLVNSSSMLSRIWFPRACIPLAAVAAVVVDLAVSLVVLLVVAAGFGVLPSPRLLALPLLLVLAVVVALGPVLLLAAVNVRYRDVRHAVPFLVQLWLFASPVAYSTSLVPEGLRLLYALNPTVGLVEGFRWVVLGTRGLEVGPLVAVSTCSATVLLVLAAYFFRSQERSFADVV